MKTQFKKHVAVRTILMGILIACTHMIAIPALAIDNDMQDLFQVMVFNHWTWTSTSPNTDYWVTREIEIQNSTIKSSAEISLQSPKVRFFPGFTVERGGKLRAGTPRVEIHFAVINNIPPAAGGAPNPTTMVELEDTIEHINRYFVSEDGDQLVRFEYGSHQFWDPAITNNQNARSLHSCLRNWGRKYSVDTSNQVTFHSLNDSKGCQSDFNACAADDHCLFAAQDKINILIGVKPPHWTDVNGNPLLVVQDADGNWVQDPAGFPIGIATANFGIPNPGDAPYNVPYIVLQSDDLEINNPAADPTFTEIHELGHAFYLGHVCELGVTGAAMDSNVMNSPDACPKTCGSNTNVGNHTMGFFTEPADCLANSFGQVYNTKTYDSRDLSQTQIIYNFSRMLLQ